MLCGSDGKRPVASCYATGANYFISRPKDSERLNKIVTALYESLCSQCQGPILHLDEYRPDPGKQPTKEAAV
jgi:hypothetical protein